jgi:DNA-directed RNA polymerase subunit alpha
MSPQEQQLLSTPVAELNLSVRSRKCMARLGIVSLSELVQRTPDELLSAKNFGVTSLNEIRAKLTELNLKLRND